MNASEKKSSRGDKPGSARTQSERGLPKNAANTSAPARKTRAASNAAPSMVLESAGRAPAAAVKETDAPKKPRSAKASAPVADKTEPSAAKVSEVTTKSKSTAASPARLITEDEIRAMSDKDYMNEAQLAFFKNRLQELERELLRNAGETTEHLRETVLVPDPADRATIEEEHALELRTRDRERKLLKKVQQSLASIEANDYGWCEETGEPIGIPRLIARPTATLSLEAQQRRELKQKLYGD
jgi:DnaK suppressor protein